MSRISGWRVREDKMFAYMGDKKRSTVQEEVYYFPENCVTDSLTTAHVIKIFEEGIQSTYKGTWAKGESNGMKVNSFFCGAGGFDLGFIQAGFEITGAWDFDKYAVQSYKHNIGDHVKQADVSKMAGADVPKANGWLFGFPCQDISVAGKQKGMIKGETRSGLFYEIMRLLGEVSDKPEWILAENVKAVKKFIPEIEKEYDIVGHNLTPQLYNSKYWGVPQNRERYFLLGIRKDLNKSFVFPEQQTDFIPKLSSILESNVDEKYYIDDLKATKIIEQAMDGLRVKQATKLGYALAAEGDSININHPTSTTRRGRVGKQIAQTIQAGNQDQVVVLKDVHACITPGRVDKRQNGRRAKENEESMFTITAQDLHGVITASYNRYRVRKLTPREYARLQGFPDSYKQVVSNSQFYKQMGNAVTVNVAYAIAVAIKEQL